MSYETRGASLDLRSVGKEFGRYTAVADVSLSIAAGEFVTLLGPSGSGKTTTLNMIAGFTKPTRGSIHLDQRPIEQLPPYRRDIGVVFQDYALFPHMNAFENVAFPLRRRRLPKALIAKRTTEVLSLVGLGDRASLYPAQLSGGQRQRVALARAIVFGARLLLMDEPLGALDRLLRETLQSEIRRIHREVGITVLYVTHDQSEAFALSDRIAVFRQGRIEQVGAAPDLYETPASLFVAQLLGEINVFPGAMLERADCVALGNSAVRLPIRSAKAPLGAPGVLVVRPERVRIAAGSAANAGSTDSLLRGRVLDMRYLGADRKVWIQTEGVTVIARQGPTDEPVLIGDDVSLLWEPEAATFLRETDDLGTQQSNEEPRS